MIMTSKSNETPCFISINACSCRSIRKWDTFIVMISSIVCRVTLWRPWSWSNYEISCKQWIYLKHMYITTLRPKKKRFVSCYPNDCIILPPTKKNLLGYLQYFHSREMLNNVHMHLSDIQTVTINFCCKYANQQIYYKKKKLTYRPIIFSARNRKHT